MNLNLCMWKCIITNWGIEVDEVKAIYSASAADWSCSSGEGGTDGKDLPVGICMCGSAHDCGCGVDGSNAMGAS